MLVGTALLKKGKGETALGRCVSWCESAPCTYLEVLDPKCHHACPDSPDAIFWGEEQGGPISSGPLIKGIADPAGH